MANLQLVGEHADVVGVARALGHHEGVVGRGQSATVPMTVFEGAALGAVVAVDVVEAGLAAAVHHGVLAKLGLHRQVAGRQFAGLSPAEAFFSPVFAALDRHQTACHGVGRRRRGGTRRFAAA